MNKKDNETVPAFRFNQSKINGTKNNVPSTIDWDILKNSLDKKPNHSQSLWGFVQNQQNGTSKKP